MEEENIAEEIYNNLPQDAENPLTLTEKGKELIDAFYEEVLQYTKDIGLQYPRLTNIRDMRRWGPSEMAENHMDGNTIGVKGSESDNFLALSFIAGAMRDEIFLWKYGKTAFQILALADFGLFTFLQFNDELKEEGARNNPDIIYNPAFEAFLQLSYSNRDETLERLIEMADLVKYLNEWFIIPEAIVMEKITDILRESTEEEFVSISFRLEVIQLIEQRNNIMKEVKNRLFK